jgi:Tfp pilus assembly protein PilX
VPTWLIIVLVVLLLLFVGGMIARAMLQRRTQAQFHAQLEQANHDLAEAAAEDRGWDRETLEAAARRCHAERAGAEPSELLLVEVIDRPGTDEDQAVFRVTSEGAQRLMTLGRRDGEWVLVGLE